jgi:hypothetical protein
MGDETVVGQAHRLDPTDGHPAVGDVGVLVKAAAGNEIRGDVVRADAHRCGQMQIERGAVETFPPLGRTLLSVSRIILTRPKFPLIGCGLCR